MADLRGLRALVRVIGQRIQVDGRFLFLLGDEELVDFVDALLALLHNLVVDIVFDEFHHRLLLLVLVCLRIHNGRIVHWHRQREVGIVALLGGVRFDAAGRHEIGDLLLFTGEVGLVLVLARAGALHRVDLVFLFPLAQPIARQVSQLPFIGLIFTQVLEVKVNF